MTTLSAVHAAPSIGGLALSLLRRFGPTLVGAAVLVALVARLGTDAVADGLRALELGPVLIALAAGVVATVAAAARWRLVARALGLRLSLPSAVGDCYRAQLLNAVLPVGVLGDVHRAVDHGRRSGDVGCGVRAVVLERLAGQLVLVAGTVGVLAAEPRLFSVLAAAVLPSGGFGIGIVAGGFALVGVVVVAGPRLRGPVARLAADVRILSEAGVLPGVVVLSVVTASCYLATFLVAARVAGSDAPAGVLLPVLALALLVMALPVNVGGFGPREAVTALAFGALGLGAAAGLSASIVYGVLSLVAALPGAVVLVLRRPGRTAEPTPVREALEPAVSRG